MKCLKQCLLFPKFNCGCGLVTLALALAWPAHGADPVLIGQWPGRQRGSQEGQASGVAVSGHYAYVALSGNYIYVADGSWGLIILGPRTPRITSVTLAAGTATVYYTNTIAGTAYTLECRTNLSAGNWQPVGTQPAPGYSAFQTDTSAGPAQRYYRVFYPP